MLATAARIAEVITHHYTQNIDLKDAKAVLSKSEVLMVLLVHQVIKELKL